MKSINIQQLIAPVDIYGGTDPNNLSLLVSEFRFSVFTITGISDSVVSYTVQLNSTNCLPLIKTFTFTVTPTPTPTIGVTPTPTITPSVVITWEPYGDICDTVISCPNGYTLSNDQSYCYTYLTTTPTNGQPLTVNNRTNTAYSNFGARIYELNGYDVNGNNTSGVTLVTTAPLWANPSNLITQGRLNAVGVWGVDNCTSNNFLSISDDWIGFTTTIFSPVTKNYYLGCAGDNLVRFKINGFTVVEQNNSINVNNFKYWHIYPIVLSEGYNFIEIDGSDDGLVSASFGAEIYDNTKQELINAVNESDLHLIFSTKNFFCNSIGVGSNYGYQCPSFYTLDLSGNAPICKKRDEITSIALNTGYKKYQFRRRKINGTLDGYSENNISSGGLGPYFQPYLDVADCVVGSIDPTPTITPSPTVTPTVTPTLTPTITPSRSFTTSGCFITPVDANYESAVMSIIPPDQMRININGLQEGLYGQGNIFTAFFISTTNCRPCANQSGTVTFTRRSDNAQEILNFTITTAGGVYFTGSLDSGLWDGVLTSNRGCVVQGGCLLKGTEITLADGRYQSIENLNIGDYLMSVDIEGLSPIETRDIWHTEQLSYFPSVTKVVGIRKYSTDMVIEFNSLLTSTREHRHFIKRNNEYLFEKAENIIPGDFFLNEDGSLTRVDVKRIETGYFETFNIDVEELDVYFANGLLTHNKNFAPNP